MDKVLILGGSQLGEPSRAKAKLALTLSRPCEQGGRRELGR